MYCPFSHVCNKIATKINCALDHHEFVCDDKLMALQTAKQTVHCTSSLFSCLFVSKKQQLSPLLYVPSLLEKGTYVPSRNPRFVPGAGSVPPGRY